MLKGIKVFVRILFSLNRIAKALEKLADIDDKEIIKKTDYKLYATTEEEIVAEEDKEISAAITNRLISIESEGNQSFFIEDDIRDILEDVNEM